MAHALNAAGYRAPELDDVFKRQPADVNAARRGARPSYELQSTTTCLSQSVAAASA